MAAFIPRFAVPGASSGNSVRVRGETVQSGRRMRRRRGTGSGKGRERQGGMGRRKRMGEEIEAGRDGRTDRRTGGRADGRTGGRRERERERKGSEGKGRKGNERRERRERRKRRRRRRWTTSPFGSDGWHHACRRGPATATAQ